MVPHDLNVDLHMHSTASDGTLSPEDLVARGAANGVQIMALTDHDTLDGLARARAAAADHGIRFFNGVEISVTWGGETLHMVGLDFDDQHPALAGSLRQVAASRFERARAMDQGLMAVGLPSIFDEAMAFAGNPNLIGRAHFARAMVARGICSHMQAVFDQYLTPGHPGYVPHEWSSLRQAMEWVHQAGGFTVLAHPARYRINATAHWALIQEFMSLGGKTIEVATGSHSLDETRRYQRLSIELGLMASRGSDFHCPKESRCDVGQAPALPCGTLPVWAGYPQRFGLNTGVTSH
jgi:predicted metal-dependent phosphoesterase TrpH